MLLPDPARNTGTLSLEPESEQLGRWQLGAGSWALEAGNWKLKMKNPGTAAVLSAILPGLGQIYEEHRLIPDPESLIADPESLITNP